MENSGKESSGKYGNKQNIFVHRLNIYVKLLFCTSNEQFLALLTLSECGGDLFAGVCME